MGIASMGIVRAEGQTTASVQSGDRVVVQRFTNFSAQNNFWEPKEATVDELASFVNGGVSMLGIGHATLVAGVATVALPAIAAGSVVLLSEANATPEALGYVVTAGTGFVIHSASNADTSVVSYVVYS